MASLHDLQASFAAALRGDTQRVAADVTSDRFESAERLQVYQNNSRAMFEGALERTYPVLRRRVGDEYFRQLAHGYRERHPSQSGDLHWVGRHFPGYVADLQAGTGYEWLAELATLEWACETALVAAHEAPVAVEALAQLEPGNVEDVRLRLQPSLVCVSASVPVLDVWRANQPDADGRSVDLAKGAQHVLVGCSETGLELRETDATVMEFTRALQDGATLGEAVDRSGLGLDALAATLGMLFAARLVTAIAPPQPEAIS